MKPVVISYSFTSNNEALAAGIAQELAAEHIHLKESKSRTNGSIAFDMIFKRTPAVQPLPKKREQGDFLIFVGPVWMGQLASPLRSYFKYLKDHPTKYAFVSISGGADGSNPKLEAELVKRTGAKPAVLLDLHIADLLPTDPKPSRQETSAYKVTPEDIQKLTSQAVQKVREVL